MISRAIAHAALIGALSSVLLVGACDGSDDRPSAAGASSTSSGGASSSNGGSSGGDSGDTTDSATIEASTDASKPGAELCQGSIQLGPTVAELTVKGAAPSALGGTLEVGTYLLSELNVYNAAAPGESGNIGRGTLYVTTDSLRIIGGRGTAGAGLVADASTGVSYTVTGTNLSTVAVCPAAGEKKVIAFSAVGGGLALFVDANHRELYTKQ